MVEKGVKKTVKKSIPRKKSRHSSLKCNFCHKNVNSKETFVLLGTYNLPKGCDEAFYHFPCFVDWYNSRVEEKARSMIGGFDKIISVLNNPALQKLAINAFDSFVSSNNPHDNGKEKSKKGSKNKL